MESNFVTTKKSPSKNNYKFEDFLRDFNKTLIGNDLKTASKLFVVSFT